MAQLPMTAQQARELLDQEWQEALAAGDAGEDPEIDALVNSRVVSIRYAVLTQILGKVADPSRNLLALQLGASSEAGAWDARSFSTAVIVPWVTANQQVLGTSAEPYASKPLRRARLSRDMTDVRDKTQWRALVTLFESLEDAIPDELRTIFRRVLRSLARRLAQQSFIYPVPPRVSMNQLQAVLTGFLKEPSGGLRPLAVAAALFETLGKGFSLFSKVESQGVNEADAASGMPGDIMCYDDANQLCLAIEVKDTALTLAHVNASSLKMRQATSGLTSFIFAVPNISGPDAGPIEELVRREWASGVNLYTIDIQTLSQTAFTLLDETWRVQFIQAVGRELDARQNQAARKAWYDLLVGEM